MQEIQKNIPNQLKENKTRPKKLQHRKDKRDQRKRDQSMKILKQTHKKGQIRIHEMKDRDGTYERNNQD